MHRAGMTLGVSIIGALLAPHAHADVSVGANAGSNGVGVEARYSLTDKLVLRGAIGTLSWDLDETYDDIAYTGKLDYSPATLALDYHPFENGWFVSGGAMLGGPGLELSATPATAVDIGGVSYTPAEVGTLNADSEIGDAAPFIALGWTNARERTQGAYFSALVGAAFYGEANATLWASGGLLESDPSFLADLADEEAQLEDDLSSFEVYPILQVGGGYRF